MRKLKKEIKLKTEIKICRMKIEKEKKCMSNYYYERKSLLNRFLNDVEGLENVSFNK